MNRWKLELILKSGARIVGRYSGLESNMADVVQKLIVGSSTSVNVIDGERANEALAFCVGDVAACFITLEGDDSIE